MFYKNPCENCFERMFKCRKYNDGVNTCGKMNDYNFKVRDFNQSLFAGFILFSILSLLVGWIIFNFYIHGINILSSIF